ncbi:hypothetical protein MVEN_02085900 [Mycena venus]|uniref:F-box domain-containing protein n=1 Tax=Mycena venus TaxID=2733690 RepID=A0A8H6XDL5_9AGAR|nr:hypothetical protein MVEN_02085900 [Mycena venus]
MPIILPQELIEEILKHLCNDFETLEACSLVCRAWVSCSRAYLFQTFTLVPDNILRARDLLRSPNCTLIPHVHSINARRNYYHDRDELFDGIAADLRRLTAVRTLDLSLASWSLIAAHAVRANAFFRTGLIAAFPNVTRLVIACDFVNQQPVPLIDMLCLFPSLEEVYIRQMDGILSRHSRDSVPPRGLHRLELCKNSPGPILAWLSTFSHLPNVHSIVLPVLQSHDIQSVREALRQLGSNLLHLDITLPYFHPSHVVDFSLHSNLRSLTIRDSWVESDDFERYTIPLIKSLAAPMLEYLSLDLDLSEFRTFKWAALDAFLCSPRFPRLRVVSLNWTGSSRDWQFMREALPLLETSGILKMV